MRCKKNRAGKILAMGLVAATVLGLAGCGRDKEPSSTELTLLAAASLTDACDQLKEQYEAEHPGVTLTFSYGASGTLQTQIEEGAPADVFISAAEKQMNALVEEDLIDSGSVQELLENKVVLIVNSDSDLDLASFEEVAQDKVAMIGLGEPKSVPAGQYAEEAFTSLGILDVVQQKANYGTDVRTVLSWVEAGEVDCGVVYATDAYSTELVKIVAQAPEGSCARVIYPVGITKDSANRSEAEEFVLFLQSQEAAECFEKYGFSVLK